MENASESQGAPLALSPAKLSYFLGFDDPWQELDWLLSESGVYDEPPEKPGMDALKDAFVSAMECRFTHLLEEIRLTSASVPTMLAASTVATARGEWKLAKHIVRRIPEGADPDVYPSLTQIVEKSASLADRWHSDPTLTRKLSRTTLPEWDRDGRVAAADVLALARKGRALGSVGAIVRRRGNDAALDGYVLAVAATLISWAKTEAFELRDLVRRELS